MTGAEPGFHDLVGYRVQPAPNALAVRRGMQAVT